MSEDKNSQELEIKVAGSSEGASADKKLVKANIKFIRQTARKVRRTVNLIRGLKAGEAVTQLRFLSYAAAEPIRKLIESAIANAAHNHGVANPEELYISQILVDDAQIMKRFRAASRGRAASVYKRSSQVRLVLSEMKADEYAAYVFGKLHQEIRKIENKRWQHNGTEDRSKRF